MRSVMHGITHNLAAKLLLIKEVAPLTESAGACAADPVIANAKHSKFRSQAPKMMGGLKILGF